MLFRMVNNLPLQAVDRYNISRRSVGLNHQSRSCPCVYIFLNICLSNKIFSGQPTLSAIMQLEQMKIRLKKATLTCEIRIAILITKDECSKMCTLTVPRSIFNPKVSSGWEIWTCNAWGLGDSLQTFWPPPARTAPSPSTRSYRYRKEHKFEAQWSL